MNNKIIIFKNDAVGDLVQSLSAINNVIINNNDKKILIYLSERSKNFSFLIKKNKNIEFKIVKYDLTFFEKIRIILFILNNDISKIYILTPKSFYFLLPLLFKNIKFYGLCIDGPNKYKRPNLFLRRYLFKYVVNARDAIFKRNSTTKIQNELTSDTDINNNFKFSTDIGKSNFLKINLPNNYIYNN